MSLRFGCGEYVPGGEPITVPNLPVPTTPVLIPNGPTITIAIPFIPGSGGGGGNEPGGGSGRGGPTDGGRGRAPGFRTGRPSGPSTGGPAVVVPRAPLGPATGGPSGPTTGGPTIVTPPTPGTGGGGSSGGSTGYRCNSVNLLCPGDRFEPKEQWRYLYVNRQCVQCNLDPEDPSCINQTQAQCVANGCTDSNNCVGNAPTNQTTGQGGTISVGSPKIPEVQGEPNQFSQNVGTTTPSVVTINVKTTGILNEPVQATVNQSQIYNNSLNFFVVSNENAGTPATLSNHKYRGVFNSLVSYEVGILLDTEGSVGTWVESTLFSLTLQHIKESINTTLLNAFNSIHHPGGQLVGERPFLNMLQKHLLTGTMSEFDGEYYISLAVAQQGDTRIQYTGLGNTENAERAGLGTIAAGAVVSDPDMQNNIRKRQIRRQRRLNTDINARIPVVPLEGAEKELFLTDAGITTIPVVGATTHIATGSGDGYYMQIDLAQESSIPLVTLSDFESTYFVPPDVRYNALTLFKESPLVTLTASSLSEKNELVAGDTGVSALDPIYMPLDLESMGYNTNKNPLVARYTGTYRTETDQDIIDEHTTNNGLAIARVNIDYRDPLYRYILDGSSVALSMNDITFKSIKDSKDFKGGIRLSRNIPFGLIITPVAGSKFNPFNGYSTLDSYGDVVVRSLGFTMDINTNDTTQQPIQLKETILYNETGGDLKVGISEPNDSQNVVHRYVASSSLYKNSFYDGNNYTTSGNTVPSYGISYLIKDVIDPILDTYNPDDIMWFDVVRRLPLNKAGELLYDTSLTLMSSLERGYRDGLLIYNVIKSENDPVGNVLADDDNVVIKVSDRHVSNT
tara:strand:+ start:7164 stop:9710 length:2547 start_codon:yes stop_codon:yes gene_type:complete